MTYEEILNFINASGFTDSVVYNALRKALVSLGNFEETEKTIGESQDTSEVVNYRKSLGKALDACDIYIGDKVHKTAEDTQDKLEFAKTVKATLMPLYENALAREDAFIKSDLEWMPRKKKKSTADELRKIADVQRNIGGSKIVARTRQITAAQSKVYTFFRDLGHKLQTGFKALGLVIGAFLYNVVAPFTTTGKYLAKIDVTKPTDTDIIPGTKEESFENEKTATLVNNGAEDQPILNDSRRMPLVYEQIIPEDPDQPPTVGLRFQQVEAGTSLGFDASGETGHGFVSLKYTKTDPLTGKPARYETVFGFYPKEGFCTAGMVVAQADEGLVVPGSVNNDFKHPYSIEKVYPVNNKAINKVILAAQQYEKDGYNMLSRNCASFVRDMADAADIPTSSFMQKTDLKSNILLLGNIGLAIGGAMMSEIGEYDMVKMGTEIDYQYSNYGKQKLSPEVVCKLPKTEFNFRTEGYIPSQITEVIRAEKSTLLSSNPYDFEETSAPEVLEQLKNGINVLRDKLDRYADKHDLPELKENNARLAKYMETEYDILFADSMRALLDFHKSGDKVVIPGFTEQRQLCRKLSAEVNRYIKDLSDIFYDTYKGDPDLNLAFNEYAGNLNALNLQIKTRYTSIYERLCYPWNSSPDGDENLKKYRNSITLEDYGEVIDLKRDDAAVVKELLFEYAQYTYEYKDKDGKRVSEEVKVPKLDVIAGIKSMGSVEKSIKYVLLSHKDENALSESEKKELAELEPQTSGIQEFSKSALSLLERPATMEDIRFAFSQLPELEDPSLTDGAAAVSFKEGLVSKPSKCLKGIIFAKTLSGLRERIENISIEQILADENVVAREVGHFLSEKIEEGSFKDVLQVIEEDVRKEYPFTDAGREKDTARTYELNLKIKIYEKFRDELTDCYVQPLLTEISDAKQRDISWNFVVDKRSESKNAQAKLDLLNKISDAHKGTANRLDACKSADYFEMVHKKFGVRAELNSQKTRCAYNTQSYIGTLKRSKKRDKTPAVLEEQNNAFRELRNAAAEMLACSDLLYAGSRQDAEPVTAEMFDQKKKYYLNHEKLNNDTVESLTSILQQGMYSGKGITAAELGLIETFKDYTAYKNQPASEKFKNAVKFFTAIDDSKNKTDDKPELKKEERKCLKELS